MTDNTKTYSIPEENLSELCRRLDKLSRKAAKLGLVTISYSLGPVKDLPFSRTDDGHRSLLKEEARIEEARRLGKLVFVRFQEVTVSGQTPRLSGWDFVGTLQHLADPEGEIINLLRTVPGFVGQLPIQFRTATPENCDHCHKQIRSRKETFIVRSTDTQEWKQVGRNCTQDFLGGKDPHAVASSLDYLLQAFDLGGESEGQGLGGGSGPIRWDLLGFLTVVATLVRTDGWCSRGKARNSEGLTATADHAVYYLEPPRDGLAKADWRKFVEARPITDEDKTTAEKALDFARDDLQARASRSDYEHNLYVATVQESVTGKLTGICASLIPYYLREVERQVVREAELRRTADSKHLGTVGERLLLNVQCAKVITVGEQSLYGPSYLHKLITAEGDAVIWFSSQALNNLTPGKTYSVKASVKKHDIRDNVKQTVVTRLSVLTDEEVTKERAKVQRRAARQAKG
jgi:hypothetical protein